MDSSFRLLTQTTDGSGGNLKDNHKQFTMDPETRYRSISSKIDHDRILTLYDTDSTEEIKFLKETFVNQRYYKRDEHLAMLGRFRRGVAKKANKKILMPIRAVMAFRRQASAPATAWSSGRVFFNLFEPCFGFDTWALPYQSLSNLMEYIERKILATFHTLVLSSLMNRLNMCCQNAMG